MTRKSIPYFLVFLCILQSVTLVGCKEEDDTYSPYYDWQARNVAWFEQAADTARRAIAKAKADYGDQWEKHCEWRMFKSLMRSADMPGVTQDSIVCKITVKGTGTVSPAFTDSVSIHFRGWLMPTEYVVDDSGNKELSMEVFTQTYYGDFNPLIAAPQQMYVGGTVEGFQTALQNMVAGDDWMVYIPAKLAYNENGSSTIPSYSTLLYRMYVEKVILGQ